MAIVAAERNNNEGSEDDVEKRLDERLRGLKACLVMAEYGNSLEIFKLFSQSGESRLGFELIRSRTRAIVGNRGCSSRVTVSYMSHIGRDQNFRIGATFGCTEPQHPSLVFHFVQRRRKSWTFGTF
ncbi:hypothetical protein I7I51_00341 [Histoplasma capsulatum]|uniref:Uncharacterized protein n=1 Tax=Ajellomyces capsulatus TaxID=5037 RepID=A0A8A1MF78_AJECA|nr:predicted protein [Histoplasma mississippiense (nom. inval.)]EDN08701.1 predicted protein [Histoplasma mississippiense (nom. inval.)]QSS63284.1 hypothetical protein I7I51_00341 [Histoplasma capsulatum]